jgi:hypothetical protein
MRGIVPNRMAKKLDLRRASLEEHLRVGKELLPPFQTMGGPMDQIFWWRDLLPQFLWIDALVQAYGEAGAVGVFRDFLSAADRFNQHPQEILDGTIGSFALIAVDRRADFLAELSENVAYSVVKPFGDILGLYPGCPMAWMLSDFSTDPTSSLSTVRDAIHRLMPGKDSYAGYCRALPLQRLLVHEKVKIFSHLTETIEAIKSYPHGDRYRAETFARNAHGSTMVRRAKEDLEVFKWSRDFWRSNLTLTPCFYD